jgi:hypothetical protein
MTCNWKGESMSHDAPRFQYTIELYKKEGEQDYLGTFAVTPDFEPAMEWARFSAIRKDPPTPLVLGEGPAAVEPVWHRSVGQPYLEGFKAIVDGDGQPGAAFAIPLGYVASLARVASARLVEGGKLQAGESFQYVVCASASEGPAATADQEASKFAVKPMGQVLDGREIEMDRLLAGARPWGAVDEDEMPVFVPQSVIEEAVDAMAAAGDTETGGILIGHLRRDRGGRGLLLEVTAQVQAQHAEHELTRLTFTPETWTAVDAALALRARGELYAGWWHTHPSRHWCDQCPPEKRQSCKIAGQSSGDFFSAHDVALHRAIFSRAYSVALVISDGCEGGHPVWRLFGWRYGMLMARGFHILHSAAPSAAAAHSGGNAHVTC